MSATPGTWSGPAVVTDTTEMMRCTNVCVPRGTANGKTYTIADSDLGAILRVRETASNAGGETTVWSARYVGPVISAQAAAAVLATGETALRNAQGTHARAGEAVGCDGRRRARQRGEAKPAGAKVTLRRPARRQGQARRLGLPGDDHRGRHAAAVQRQGHAAQVGHVAPSRVDGRQGAGRGDPRQALSGSVIAERQACPQHRAGAGSAVDVECAADRGDPIAEPLQA